MLEKYHLMRGGSLPSFLVQIFLFFELILTPRLNPSQTLNPYPSTQSLPKHSILTPGLNYNFRT